jgi:hypothetical protein
MYLYETWSRLRRNASGNVSQSTETQLSITSGVDFLRLLRHNQELHGVPGRIEVTTHLEQNRDALITFLKVCVVTSSL